MTGPQPLSAWHLANGLQDERYFIELYGFLAENPDDQARYKASYTVLLKGKESMMARQTNYYNKAKSDECRESTLGYVTPLAPCGVGIVLQRTSLTTTGGPMNQA